MEEEDEFSLDEARETLFTLQRACERHAANLAKLVDALNSKQSEDEWLMEVLDEATKGVAFHQQQLDMVTAFHGRANAYVEAVRQEANQLALAELSGRQPEDEQEGEGNGDATTLPLPPLPSLPPPPPGAGAPPVAAGRRRSSKFVHPELLKFKLEKQAKILGKYGGIPALGAGLVLPRLQRDSILKATGSPAAREIHYSKVEGKDAPQLAEVMRFKARKKGDEGGEGEDGTPAPSPWQQELTAKKGKQALDGTDARDQVTPSTRSHAVYGEELGGVLQQRQAALEAAMAAERSAASSSGGGGADRDGPAGHISADAGDELAAKLKRRQSAAAALEAAAAAAEAEAAEAAATPATPAWSNAAAPFGGELTAALQRRAEAQRAAAAEAAEAGAEAAGPAAAGGATPSTPVFGLVTPSALAAARRSAPPRQLAGLLATPPPPRPPAAQPPLGLGGRSAHGSAGAAGGDGASRDIAAAATAVTPGGGGGGGGAALNELQEKLRRRLSNLEAPPAAPAPAVAAEAQ